MLKTTTKERRSETRLGQALTGRKLGFSALAAGAILLGGGNAFAQVPQPVFDYGFEQIQGSYQEITTTPIFGPNAPSSGTQTIQVPLTINFRFNGTSTDPTSGTLFGPSATTANQNISIVTNGYAVLGTVSTVQQSPLSNGGFNNVLSPLGMELDYSSASTIRTQHIVNPGANDDVFVIQWSDFQRFQDSFNPFAGQTINGQPEAYDFQLRLYEGSNQIEFVYGDFTVVYETVGHNSPVGRQEHPMVGLRGTGGTNANTTINAHGAVNTRTTETDWANSTAGVRNNARMVLTTVVKPEEGLTYRWNMPISCASASTLNPGQTLVSRAYSCGSTSSGNNTPPSPNPLTIGTSGTTDGSSNVGVTGVYYIWEASNSMNGTYSPYDPDGTGPLTAVTQLPVLESPAGNQWYRVRVACDAAGTATGPFSTPVFVNLDTNGTPNGSPYPQTGIVIPAAPYLNYSSGLLSNRNSDCVQNNYNTGNNDQTGLEGTAGYNGDVNAQNSPDVRFNFTTGACTKPITISTCNTQTNFNTYLHLLAQGGSHIASNDDVSASDTCSSITFTPTANTTYRVIVEGKYLQQGDFFLTIMQTPDAAPTVAPTSTVACPGGTVFLSANASPAGSYTYTWTGPGITPAIANQENPQLNNVTVAMAGQYTVTVNAPCADPATGTVDVYVGSGPYTVDSSVPSSGNSFQTLAELENALNSGSCGPVTVNFVPGTYTESLTLGNYGFPITLNGNGATLESCGGYGSTLITLDGTDNVVIEGFTLNAPCMYGRGIWLKNGTDNIIIRNNDITVPMYTSVANVGILAQNPGMLTIQGNDIFGGRYGISVQNATGTVTIGGVNSGSGAADLLGNRVVDAYEYGIGVFNATGATLSRNTVSMRSGNRNTAVHGRDLTNFTFDGNLIINAGRVGISLNSSATGTLVNNRVGLFQSIATQATGVYMANTTGVDVYHNSLWADAGSDYSYGMRLLSGTADMDVQNNIFASSSAVGAPLYGGANAFSTLSHNNYYNSGGSNIAFLSKWYTQLANFPAQFSTAGSLTENPMLSPAASLATAFATALKTGNSALADLVLPVLGGFAAEDFEGDDRVPGKIAMGADEFDITNIRLASSTTAALSADVYPNPFQSALTIGVQDLSAGTVQVTLTDLMGRQIMSQQFGVEKGANTISLPVEENIAQGVYLLQVTQGEATATFRVVKH